MLSYRKLGFNKMFCKTLHLCCMPYNFYCDSITLSSTLCRIELALQIKIWICYVVFSVECTVAILEPDLEASWRNSSQSAERDGWLTKQSSMHLRNYDAMSIVPTPYTRIYVSITYMSVQLANSGIVPKFWQHFPIFVFSYLIFR